MSSLEEVSKKNDELIRKSTASKVFIISRCISILSLTVVALCFEQWRLWGLQCFYCVVILFLLDMLGILRNLMMKGILKIK